VEVSGRKGLGVKADDLIDRLADKALFEVKARNEGMAAADAERVARQIAVAAVRYFLVKFSRGKIIAFDLDEALSFEGESGPYIQYAVVRARKILRRMQDQLGLTEAALMAGLPSLPGAELDGANGTHEVWGLILDAARLDDVVEQVIRTLEFSVLAKYAFSLAQSFNAFYHRAPIVNEERDDVRRWRAAAVVYVQAQLTRALGLMGVEIPALM
jgi:arginyl-tRNA synthetase